MKMKAIYKIVSLCLILSIGTNSCDKFEEYNTNPDESSKVTSAMLATNLILSIKSENQSTKGFMSDDMLSKYIAWTEGNDIDNLFNKLGRRSYSSIGVLRNVEKMIDAANGEKAKNSYNALGHFLRVFKFFDLTLRVGDIPYNDALKGESEGVHYPAYDTQKDVFAGMLKELELADQLFQSGDNIGGDPIYSGDIAKWRKLVNTYELKLLINLYRKSSDTDLKIKDRFKDIVNNKPIFTSNADNFQFVYSDKSGQKYPFYKEGNSFIVYNQVSSIVIDTLKRFNDYRLFYYAKPTPLAAQNGLQVSDWNAYNGVNPTLTFAEIQTTVEGKNVSQLNLRYSEIPAGEPTAMMSYSEMNFILAEAVVRGLLAGDAKAYYEEGVRAAMKFVADNTPDQVDYHHNMKITDSYISSYLQGPQVAFAATPAKQINQIIMQKYLSTFLQAAYNGYYEYRRTGVPALPINPASNRNLPADQMPVRWMYPQAEYDYNSDNVNAAVTSQYGGSDTENGVMWILKD